MVLPGAGRTITGEVAGIGHVAADRGRLFPVVVRVQADAALRPGVTAELVVDVEHDGGQAVPIEAVINPGGSRPSVFVVDDGVATEREVDMLRVVGTVAGLLPLGLSEAALWPPLAWAMITGLVASTALTCWSCLPCIDCGLPCVRACRLGEGHREEDGPTSHPRGETTPSMLRSRSGII